MQNLDIASEVERNLQNVSIGRKPVVDITDIFRRFKDDLIDENPDKVFKSSYFDLFNSTSALEVNRSNLDSSLIVAENKIKFDTSFTANQLKELLLVSNDEESIFVILDYILRSFINWIKDNGSLTTNFISIKYVEDILVCYSSTLTIKNIFNSGDWLIDDLLRLFVSSLIFVVKILNENCNGNDYIREEEDIRFDSLGLNFFSEHSFEEDTEKEFKKYIEQLQDGPLKSMCFFVYSFTDFLVTNMTADSLEREIVLYEPFKRSFIAFKEDRNKVSEVIAAAQIPSNLKTYLSQRIYSNTFPKKRIPSVPFDNYDVIDNIIGAFDSTNGLLSGKTRFVGAELTERMYYVFTHQFQYYYDDDKLENNYGKINCLNRIFYLSKLASLDMTRLNGVKIMKHITEDIKSVIFLNEETEQILLSDQELKEGPLAIELQSLQQIYVESLLSKLRNQCQYRQSFSKHLLYWDSVQANIAQFEDPYPVDLANNLDKFPAISLWVYFQKMNSMAEFLLRGFALNIYSEWEFFAVYWNSYNIISENFSLLTQFHSYNKLMLQRYQTQNLNKNLKKKHKDAAKRLRIKDRNIKYIEQLTKIITNLDSKLIETETLSLLCFAQCLRYTQLLRVSENRGKVLQFLKEDSTSYIYEVRFKAFESIGSPQLPKHDIGNIIDSFMTDEKLGSYMNTALNKLKILQPDLLNGKMVIEKKDYWLRISNSIANLVKTYLKDTPMVSCSPKNELFFKIDSARDMEKKMHEYFPTF